MPEGLESLERNVRRPFLSPPPAAVVGVGRWRCVLVGRPALRGADELLARVVLSAVLRVLRPGDHGLHARVRPVQRVQLPGDLLVVAGPKCALVREEQASCELVPRLAAVELQLDPIADRRVLQVPQDVDGLEDAPSIVSARAGRSELAASRSSTTCAGAVRLRSDDAIRTSASYWSRMSATSTTPRYSASTAPWGLARSIR